MTRLFIFHALLIFSILFLPLSFTAEYPVFNGYQIDDLTADTPDLFDLQAKSWTASGLVSSAKTSVCNGEPLLGGFEILSYLGYFEREYDSLPTHTTIQYDIEFLILDNWSSSDKIQVTFDSTTTSTTVPNTYTLLFGSNVCGQSDNDIETFSLVGKVSHNAGTLTLRITSLVNKSPSVASFGIKKVSLTFASPSDSSSGQCYYAPGFNIIEILEGKCSCDKGQYWDVLSCSGCNGNCADCYDSSASTCYSCKPGYSFTGTQCIQCSSTCSTCSGPSANQCTTCAGSRWLYADGTCQDTCTLSTRYQTSVDSFNLCKFPCESTEYAVWDQTCATSCPIPLKEVIIGSDKFCDKPCADGEIWHWSGTCISSCDAPLAQETVEGVEVCKPCPSGQFYDWTNTCVSTCPSPLKQETQNLVDLCKKPCATAGDFYDWTNTCVNSCPAPLIQDVVNQVDVCKKPCADGEFRDWTASCVASCDPPKVQTIVNQVDICKPCDTNEFYDWTNTCVSTCPSPLAQTSQNYADFCKKPCTNSGDFWNWNNQCISSCPTPLIQDVVNQVDVCKKPCADGEFRDWTGTCISSCSPPLVQDTVNQVNICKPCATGRFYDWNNNCVSTCPSPLVQTTANYADFCNKPCTNSGDFLDWTNTCVSTCPDPLVQETVNQVATCKKPCPDAEFKDWNGNCITSCDAPLISNTVNQVKTCSKPCTIAGQFYDWTNTCVNTCPAPLIQDVVNQVDVCKKPCANGEFRDWTATCVSSCDPPKVQTIVNQVDICKPCNTGEFYDWTSTCVGTCLSPLVQSTVNYADFCKKPCTNSGDFFNWNNQCVSTCPTPLIQDTLNQVAICKQPCPGEYLYPNGTCKPGCSSPFVSATENSINVCNYPCDFAAGEFLTLNNLCVTTCDVPDQRIVDEFRYCDEIVQLPQTRPIEYSDSVARINETLQVTGTMASIGAIALAFAKPSSPTSMSLSSLVAMLQYIRYIDINYPTKVEQILEGQGANGISLNFGPEFPESLQDDFPDRALPGKFDQYDNSSSFLVNYWSAATTLLIIISIIMISVVGSYFANKKNEYAYAFFNRIKRLMKWDFFLMIFSSNFDGIALFTSFELRTVDLDSFPAVLSFLACLAVNFVAVYFLVKVVWVLRDIRRTQVKSIKSVESKDEEEKPVPEKWKSFYMFYESFEEESFIQQAFVFFFLSRVFLFDMIIGHLFEYPLAQTILILIMSIFMLSYLIIKRPFKERYDLGEFILNEIILLIVNINIFVLAIIDRTDPYNEDTRAACGEAIIVCNVAFNIISLIVVAIELITKLYQAYKIIRKVKGKDKWIQIFFLYFEKDGIEVKERRQEPEIDISPITPEPDENCQLKQESSTPIQDQNQNQPPQKASYETLINIEGGPKLSKFFSTFEMANGGTDSQIGSNLMTPAHGRSPTHSLIHSREWQILPRLIDNNSNKHIDENANSGASGADTGRKTSMGFFFNSTLLHKDGNLGDSLTSMSRQPLASSYAAKDIESGSEALKVPQNNFFAGTSDEEQQTDRRKSIRAPQRTKTEIMRRPNTHTGHRRLIPAGSKAQTKPEIINQNEDESKSIIDD